MVMLGSCSHVMMPCCAMILELTHFKQGTSFWQMALPMKKTLNQTLTLPFEFGCHDHNSCGELKVEMLSISAGTYHMGDGQWRKNSNGTG